MPDGDWKSLIDRLESGNRPAVVVTSDNADNRMWAEVLNLGAYDLLLKPFDALEVLRAVALAWHSRQRSHALSGSGKLGPKPASAPAPAAYAAAG
jgi:DNA-binding response OmpR family regulator